ncbi:MAG: DNA-3-methyladenine glycosylase 2 family protein [Alphaproteobacteria bacterium]|nr:DNA-3-methyladenine glycosylase 2 family protein [Alphaproteobacteria bacterium]
MEHFRTSTDLAAAVERLIALEARFRPILDAHGLPALRQAPASLEGLLAIVTEQFLSLSAGAAIWARVLAHVGEVNAPRILSCTQEQLLALGLSRAKAKCFHAAAQACASGGLDFGADSKSLRRQLLAIWGIGPWTADVFLLTARGHADAWPAGDLALQVAAQDFLKLSERPDARQMDALAEPWRPFRAAAARLLWSHYRALNGMAQAPSQE